MSNNVRYFEEQLVIISSQIEDMRSDLSEIKNTIATQNNSALPLIHKPSNCSAGLNVARFLRERIDQLNSNLPENRRYHQFPAEVADTILNRTCKSLLERWMKAEFKDVYGRITWSEAYASGFYRQCESVLGKAERHSSLRVFKQTVNSWAIVQLASQKLRSAATTTANAAQLNNENGETISGLPNQNLSLTTGHQEDLVAQPTLQQSQISPVTSAGQNATRTSRLSTRSPLRQVAARGIQRRRYNTRSSRSLGHVTPTVR